MKKTTIRLKPIHPNAGVEAAYREKLFRLIKKMDESVSYWTLRDTMRDAEHAVLVFAGLTGRWTEIFDIAAEKMATSFVREMTQHVEGNFARQIKAYDLSIPFKRDLVGENAVSAVIQENVALIKSIPKQYLSDVEGMVMRSIAAGGDRRALQLELQHRYGLTRKRAAFIANDQSSKANAVMVQSQQEAIGCTEAEWLHSGGGREPRPDHVKASGKRYDIKKGMLLDDGWVKPGMLPNCRCVSIAVIDIFESINNAYSQSRK